jgi:VWFA-related protein
MLKQLFVITCLALIAGVVPVIAQDKDDDEVIKVNTRLVSVPVIVTGSDGRYVPNLQASDFVILEDGKQRTLDFFGTSDEPFTIALLIDTSHSTKPVLGDIKDAGKSLINLLRPKDQAAIVTFDREVTILCPLTSDREQLKKAVKDAAIPEPRGTVLRDAVFETVFNTFAGLSGRKALIVLTDGKDGGSRVAETDLLLRLQETDTLIYTVQFRTEDKILQEKMLRTGTISRRDAARIMGGGPPSRAEQRTEKAADFLRNLSMVTAGRYFSSEAGQLKKTFEAILDELRLQYRLGFYPPDSSDKKAVHEVRVAVRRPNLNVRARASYRLEEDK